ncbi:MAG: hypothetical protein HY231_11275 [Acidobacteria bacterium]|nr:hypothetical protein [Acidobacteriota bacterium]
MKTIFELLLAASLIGGLDVVYFHLYRFRLYRRPASVAEEITHLARAALFIAMLLVVMFAPSEARRLLLALFVADLANTLADVLIERRSRASLGGLPSAEYLLHILGSLLSGAAIAAFWLHSQSGGFAPMRLAMADILRGGTTLAISSVLLVVESVLFARSLAARRLMGSEAPTSTPTASVS